MNVKELLELVELKDVHESILRLYEREKNRVIEGVYERLYHELKEFPTVENLNHMTIHVEYVKESERGDVYIWYTSYSSDRRYHHQYVLDFATKEQIASFIVEKSDLDKLPLPEYVAHVLFDIAREGQMVEEDGIECEENKTAQGHREEIEYRSVDQVMKDLEDEEFVE